MANFEEDAELDKKNKVALIAIRTHAPYNFSKEPPKKFAKFGLLVTELRVQIWKTFLDEHKAFQCISGPGTFEDPSHAANILRHVNEESKRVAREWYGRQNRLFIRFLCETIRMVHYPEGVYFEGRTWEKALIDAHQVLRDNYGICDSITSFQLKITESFDGTGLDVAAELIIELLQHLPNLEEVMIVCNTPHPTEWRPRRWTTKHGGIVFPQNKVQGILSSMVWDKVRVAPVTKQDIIKYPVLLFISWDGLGTIYRIPSFYEE